MEPEVRYCTASDGIRIAYTVTGEGPPHLIASNPMTSHVRLQWAHPVLRPMFVQFSAQNTLIQFDPRGSALSDRAHARDINDYVLDIEAVVRRLDLGEFVLNAGVMAAPPAIAFAARHSEQVQRLVLGFARFADHIDNAQMQAFAAAAAADWEMASELYGTIAYGAGREESRSLGEFVRACVGPDYVAHFSVLRTIDATPFLAAVSAPTMVMHHTGLRVVTVEMTRELVSGLRDARLTTVEGAWADDPAGMAKRAVDFLSDGWTQYRPAHVDRHGGVRTILFTDLVGPVFDAGCEDHGHAEEVGWRE